MIDDKLLRQLVVQAEELEKRLEVCQQFKISESPYIETIKPLGVIIDNQVCIMEALRLLLKYGT